MAHYVILSANFGHGHNKAAANIGDVLSAKGHTVKITDFFSVDHEYISRTMSKVHEKMVSKSPSIFGLLCEISRSPHAQELTYYMNHLNRRLAHKIIEMTSPDAVICTHFTPLGSIGALRDEGLSIPVFGVVTDFCAHPVWASPGITNYFVAHDDVAKDLVKAAVPPDTIKVTGIPVGSQFRPTTQKQSDKTRVLIMGGGLGLGCDSMLDGLKSCQTAIEATFLTGRNERLRDSLLEGTKNFPHECKILSYTNEVARLMQASDILITKPGGLTCAEAIAAELPMIVYNPLPGPEEKNARFLVEEGVGLLAEKEADLGRLIDKIANKQRLGLMKKCCSLIAKPLAAETITEEVVSLSRCSVNSKV
jgi:processive 1,2-diacylglycerol beta-glucosyltransferase